MTHSYESSNGTNTLTDEAYRPVEQKLDDQIEYWENQRAAVALGQFLEENQGETDELERINEEIFVGESLKTILEASIGEDINTENATQIVQGYLQTHT